MATPKERYYQNQADKGLITSQQATTMGAPLKPNIYSGSNVVSAVSNPMGKPDYSGVTNLNVTLQKSLDNLNKYDLEQSKIQGSIEGQSGLGLVPMGRQANEAARIGSIGRTGLANVVDAKTGALSAAKDAYNMFNDNYWKEKNYGLEVAKMNQSNTNTGTWSATTDANGMPAMMNNKTGELRPVGSVGTQSPAPTLNDQEKNALSVAINQGKSTWGDIVGSLKEQGITDQQLATGGALDLALNQQFNPDNYSQMIATQQPRVAGTMGSSNVDSSAPGYSTQAVPGTGGMTQAEIDKAATYYAMTNLMPPIGLGSTGSAALKRNAITNRAGELDANGNISTNKAKLTSLTASLNQQTTYANTMERSVKTVDDNLQILSGIANSVNKDNSPIINEWKNKASTTLIGNGDLFAFKAAIQTVRNEYAIILGRGSSQVTDSMREDAKQLIPDNITKSQLDKVIGVLKAEGQNVINEAHGQVESINNDLNNIIGGGNSHVGQTSSGANYQVQGGISASGNKYTIKQTQ